MRKLILKCGWSPGDIVLLTGAVRDLHLTYPGVFQTDVRTCCPELWEHNPHLTRLSEADADVEVIDCAYSLLDSCNELPYHSIHGFVEFLNERLGLAVKPTAFHGDIHLSDQEKAWYSQVHELTGEDTPFWIVAAGGKFDVTIKWWATERYQAVVDHFAGRILFVQVGERGHYHPKLSGIVDLRGQTTLRELIRLVYHAEGVFCSITALMHLAAAVETRPGRLPHRPCVVVAGGREPVSWEAYPHHQFIHTNGALACCATGGCWRDRVVPLGDGDERDQPDRLCADVVGSLPRCLDIITPEDVIRRIDTYFQGGACRYLEPVAVQAAKRGIRESQGNDYDDLPLTIHDARLALKKRLSQPLPPPPPCEGRGVVLCGGGVRYFTNAWVCLRMLRKLGCKLPVELWYSEAAEWDDVMEELVRPLGVTCINAERVQDRFPTRMFKGWALKPYSILHCSFREVLYLDADNLPVVDPEFLFETPAYRATGALFWPDFGRFPDADPIWRSCGLEPPETPEFESGQMVLDKGRCWEALWLTMWFNENCDFYYRHLYGDKETFHLAFRKLGTPFTLVPVPIHPLQGTMCQHDFEGNRIFQHRNTDKWNLFLRNATVDDFWFEKECRGFVGDLRKRWDGRSARYAATQDAASDSSAAPSLEIYLMSCRERSAVREATLASLAKTDWSGDVRLQLDPASEGDPKARQTANAFLALKQMSESAADYFLLLEDDLEFNRHLMWNVSHWPPFRRRAFELAGLYNPGLVPLAANVQEDWIVVAPEAVFGSQALILSKSAVRFCLQHWGEVEGMQDIRLSRLIGRMSKPIYYHIPSLVQHAQCASSWGGASHEASDFDGDWRAPEAAARKKVDRLREKELAAQTQPG